MLRLWILTVEKYSLYLKEDLLLEFRTHSGSEFESSAHLSFSTVASMHTLLRNVCRR